MLRTLLGFLSFILISSVSGQNFSGQWKGSFIDNSTKFIGWGGDHCEYVIEIEAKGKIVTGFSYTYFSEAGKKFYTICRLEGSINKAKKYIEITEVERTKTNVPENIRNCFQIHKLTYSKQEGEDVLSGSWIPVPDQPGGDCGYGVTSLTRRVLDNSFRNNSMRPIAKAPEKKLSPPVKHPVVSNPSKTKPAPTVRNNAVKKPVPIVANNTAKKPVPVITNNEVKKPAPVVTSNAVKKPAPVVTNTAVQKPVPVKKQPDPSVAGTAIVVRPQAQTKINSGTQSVPVKTPSPVLVKEKPKMAEVKLTPQKANPQPDDSALHTVTMATLPARFEKRKNSVLQTIEVENEVIKVDLYDNGEIDGDSISLFYNGKLLLSHKRLSEKAISLNITVDPDSDDINELIMYAENLGSIPPNTALMVVTDGPNRYEVRITSDLKKSGAIDFVHKQN